MSRLAKVLAVVILAVLATGFFYLHVLARRIFLETPQHREDTMRSRLSEAAFESASTPGQTVTLYFVSLDQRQLLAEKRQMALAAGEADRIRQILLALIEGSHLSFGRTLPPSTDIRAVFLTTDGTAYVDFSDDALADFTPGIASETLAVYSVVNSLAANIPAVKRVKILMQGREVETLDGHADLNDPFAPDPSRNASP